MAVEIVTGALNKSPTSGARAIDWANPITRGLIYAGGDVPAPPGSTDGSAYFTRTHGLLSNVAQAAGTQHGYFAADVPDAVGAPFGPALNFDGTRKVFTQSITGVASGLATDESCVVVCTFGSSSGSQHLFGFGTVFSTSLSDYGRGVGVESGQVMAWGASASNLKRVYATLPPLNTPCVIAVRFAVDGAVYINGQKVGSGDMSHSWGYYLATGCAVAATESVEVANFTGLIGPRRWWRRGLRDDELQALSVNPQLIYRQQPRVSFPTIGGGGVSVTPTGVSATGSVGSVTVSGKASTTPTGVSATGSVGTVTVAAKASTTATGSSATGAVGTPAVTGDANTTPTGASATGSVGSVTVTVGGAVSVTPTGVSATGSVGTPTVAGDANTTPTGVSATGAIGTVTVTSGAVSVTATGVSATGAVGTPTVTGKASTTPTGVSATGAVGTVTVLTPSAGMVYVTGVQGTTGLGSVSVLSGRRVQVTGVSATGLVGYPIVWSNIPTPGGAWVEVPTSATPSWTPVATPTNTWTNVLT